MKTWQKKLQKILEFSQNTQTLKEGVGEYRDVVRVVGYSEG